MKREIRMNAEDIRKLMPKTADEIVDEIVENCAKLAMEGKEKLTTGNYDFGAKYKLTEKQEEIIEKLRERGFNASQRVECNQLFVRTYLWVSWAKEK